MSAPIRLAVIADPHVHDCAWVPAGSGLGGAIRSFADTANSTRVFNESLPAFRRALELAVSEGAKAAILIGDLTDDGQAPNIARAMALIEEFRAAHGLRIFATPGNHDLFALEGRPQVKGFAGPDGRPALLDSALCPEAATLGTLPALRLMERLGYMPDPADLHWETPFGQDPSWEARQYTITSPDGGTRARVIDASYLVEPLPGLWLLSLDANVCIPQNGAADLADPAAWIDPTGNGWPMVLAHRAHFLPWMRDVAARAKAGGKRLVAFSHYPVLDALGGASAPELALFGATTGLARRAPTPEVAGTVAATGIGLHVSGHLHVNSTTHYRGDGESLVNISVPSPVGFAPGMKIFDLGEGLTRVRTLPLSQVPGHDIGFAAYRREAEAGGQPVPAAALAPDHGSFLDRHLSLLVSGRYMPREWPPEMAGYAAQHRLGDLLDLLGIAATGAPDLPLSELADDWYRLRKGGELGRAFIAPERLAFWQQLCAALPAPVPGEDPRSTGPMFRAFLAIMGLLLDRLPDGDFEIAGPDLRIRR